MCPITQVYFNKSSTRNSLARNHAGFHTMAMYFFNAAYVALVSSTQSAQSRRGPNTQGAPNACLNVAIRTNLIFDTFSHRANVIWTHVLDHDKLKKNY